MPDRKDTYYSSTYKTGTIHTCENRTTGKTEVQAQVGSIARPVATVAGAKRLITKMEKERATGGADFIGDPMRDGATLDRQIEGLARAVLNWRDLPSATAKEEARQWREHTANKETLRTLIKIAGDFATINKTSLLILIRLNLSLRAVPLHNFGGFIQLETLLK